MLKLLPPLGALLILAGCATTATPEQQQARQDKFEADLAKALKGRTPAGDPRSCINMRDIRSTKIVRPSTVIYEMGGDLAYRNDFGGSCVGLSDTDTMITRTPTNQLCRGDIVRIADLSAGFQSGSCVFGDFVPYRKAK